MQLDTTAVLQNLPNASISEDLRTDDIVVTIEFTSELSDVSYSVSVVPRGDVVVMGNTSVKLMVPYNIQHNVSVTASLCGLSSTTSIYTVFHGKLNSMYTCGCISLKSKINVLSNNVHA